jgi:hypothetical protein
MSVSDIYEKMLKDPKNRRSSSGQIKQPTPFDSGGGVEGVKPPVDEDTGVSAEEMAFLNAVDSRLANKQSKNESGGVSNRPTSSPVNEEIQSLKHRVKELEDLVTVMMKQQMKLMGDK